MSQHHVVDNISTPEVRVGALLCTGHLAAHHVGAHEEITDVPAAVNYVYQKIKGSRRWKHVEKGIFLVVAGAAGFGIGVATGGAALGTLAGAGIGLAADVGKSATLDKAIHVVGGALARGTKAVYKELRHTKGVHRRQAAHVLLKAASHWKFHDRKEDDRDGRLAYDTLNALLLDDARLRRLLGQVALGGANPQVAAAEAEFADLLKS